MRDQAENEKSVPSDFILNTLQKISMQTLTISSVALFVTQANFDVIASKTKQDLIMFLKQYIENAYVMFNKKRLDYEGITINVHVEKWTEFVYKFNPLDFIMVIDNLISNSRKAKAHVIDVYIIKKNENELEIRVKDDGIGIPSQNIDKLFSFGFSTTDGGTGIGLYQVKKIIDKYGEMKINNSLLKGVEFIIQVRRSL